MQTLILRIQEEFWTLSIYSHFLNRVEVISIKEIVKREILNEQVIWWMVEESCLIFLYNNYAHNVRTFIKLHWLSTFIFDYVFCW